uniref:aralkylamine N-acetyltransferase n=1 Tax=Steinernema glaseri TaxID=37863 RepID=A0A1I8ATY6_9BILA
MPPLEITDPKEGLRVVPLVKSDREGVLAFLYRDFRRFEPHTRFLDVSKAEAKVLFEGIVDDCLQYPISCAMKKDGTIVGVCLNTYLTRPKEGEEEEPFKCDNAKANLIVDLLDAVRSQLWEQLPKTIEKLVDISIISVDSSYGRRGIGIALVEALDDNQLRMDGVQGLVSELTNMKSQQLMTTKLGFRKIYEIKHVDWKDEKGRQIFDCSKFNTDRVVLAFKPL